MSDIQRDIGRMEARQDATDERLDRIESKIDRLGEKVDKLYDREQRRSGMVAAALTTAGAIGAGIAEGVRALLK